VLYYEARERTISCKWPLDESTAWSCGIAQQVARVVRGIHSKIFTTQVCTETGLAFSRLPAWEKEAAYLGTRR
jgi:hypothetical protein